MTKNDSRPTFLEFFAGGGLARIGLQDHFACVFANDNDPLKEKTYLQNFGTSHFNNGDVWRLNADEIPSADLAWASFPCQDTSIAGERKGLNAPRSGVFWGFWRVMETLIDEDRSPNTLVLENVAGLISSRRGRDFIALVETLSDAGYRVGAIVMDAQWFSPQSRQRLFIIAHKGKIPNELETHKPDPFFYPTNLISTVDRLDPATRLAWVWWKLPRPPTRESVLIDLLERNVPDTDWRTKEATIKLIDQLSPAHKSKFETVLADKSWNAGAVYRRIRSENGIKVQRAEIRYDGIAGCLRTPAGGSSKQLLLITHNGQAHLRAINGREAARLMGLEDDYVLPSKETPALKVIGDAVSVPVVKWLSEHLLSKLAKTCEKRNPTSP